MTTNHQRLARASLLVDVSRQRAAEACERLEHEANPTSMQLRVIRRLLGDVIELLDEISEKANL